jgi:hypothetical protein
VLSDVLAGFVSPARAAADYGVAVAADGRSVDHDATGARRAERPPAALFHRHTYQEALD